MPIRENGGADQKIGPPNIGDVAEWFKAPDLKSGEATPRDFDRWKGSSLRGFETHRLRTHLDRQFGGPFFVALIVKQVDSNRLSFARKFSRLDSRCKDFCGIFPGINPG